MATWISDDNGNRCSIEYFGSEEAARKALESLKNCRNCTNCSDCSGCSRCSRCSGCSYCSDCSGCSDCSYCSYCSDCSDCSYCSGCSGCSRCSGCSYCSDCSYCSHVANLHDREGLHGDPDGAAPVRPAIPAIEDIHRKVYEAAAQDGALNMSDWHTCGTTHCRAGWVVHLAGDAGYALERFHNTPLAAQLIYRESGYEINPGRFYDSNDDALADMKRLAETEAA